MKMNQNQLNEFLEKYNLGLMKYRNKEFLSATEFFKQALELKNDDRPSQLYIERCELNLKNPPDQNWDGVYDMESK